MGQERRAHKRFSATAFLNTPVSLKPLLPYWGEPCEGLLIDLSGGGLSILMDQIIPQGTNLNLDITFPDNTQLTALVEVNHVFPRGRKYLHGIQFIVIEPARVEWIDNMSSDYIDCEARITHLEKEVCFENCAFFNMCNKPQKKPGAKTDPNLPLQFTFKPQEKDSAAVR